MCTLGYHDASLDILTVAFDSQDKWSCCSCVDGNNVSPSDQDFCRATGGQANVDTLNKVIVPRVVYMLTERDVTPDAICYEMLRFIDAPPGYNINFVHEIQTTLWFD